MGRDAIVERKLRGIRTMSLRAPMLSPAILSLLACMPALSQAPVNPPTVPPAAGEGSSYAIERWTIDGGGGQLRNMHRSLDWRAVEAGDFDAGGGQFGDIPIFQIDHVARHLQQRGSVGGGIVAGFGNAEKER